ncbi:rCG45394, partial [Rattus norvegicus]
QDLNPLRQQAHACPRAPVTKSAPLELPGRGDFAGRRGVGLASFFLPGVLCSIAEEHVSHQRRGDPETTNHPWVIKGPAIVHLPHPSTQLN